jgi:hypothetical protein
MAADGLYLEKIAKQLLYGILNHTLKMTTIHIGLSNINGNPVLMVNLVFLEKNTSNRIIYNS